MLNFEPKFISIGANKVTYGADWNIYGQVAFAASKFVTLFEPLNKDNTNITETLLGHKDCVKGVRFLKYGKRQGKILVSYSEDKTIRIWKKKEGKWVSSCVMVGHTGNIESVAIIAEKNNLNNLIIVSSSTDETIRVWRLEIHEDIEDTYQCIQTIKTKKYYSLALELAYLPNSDKIILASGGTNMIINIFIFQEKKNTFEQILSLQGHTDWIRSLSFAKIKNHPETLMLASSSQDKYIRVWKISGSMNISNSTTNTNTTSNDMLSQKKDLSSKDIFESFSLNNM